MAITEDNVRTFIATLKSKGEASKYGAAFTKLSKRIADLINEQLKSVDKWESCQKSKSAANVDAEADTLASKYLALKNIITPLSGLKQGIRLIDTQQADVFGTPFCQQVKTFPVLGLAFSTTRCSQILLTPSIAQRVGISAPNIENEFEAGAVANPPWASARQNEISTGSLSIGILDNALADISKIEIAVASITLTELDQAELNRFTNEMKALSANCVVSEGGGGSGGSTSAISSSNTIWWVLGGGLVIGGAAYFMLRDKD